MKKKIIAVLCFVFLISAICPIPVAHAWKWNRDLVECLWTDGHYVWQLVVHEGDPGLYTDYYRMGIRPDGSHYWTSWEWVWEEYQINNNS